MSRLLAQPSEVDLGLVPAHADGRVTRGLRKARVVPIESLDGRPMRRFGLVDVAAFRIVLAGLLYVARPLLPQELVFPDRERISDGHLMPWILVAVEIAARLIGRRAHHEFSQP